MRRLSFVLPLLVGVVLALPVGAQINDAPTVTGETGMFTLFSGDTLPQGEWSFGFYYNNWDRLVGEPLFTAQPLFGGYSDDWDYDHNRLSASAGYGILDNFEISVMLPYEMLEAKDRYRYGMVNGKFFADEIDATGLGNVRLGGKWRFMGEQGGENTLALNAFVDLPTGDDDEGVVTGDTGYGVGLAWRNRGLVANVGYAANGDAGDVSVPNSVLAGLGYGASVSEKLDWITELTADIRTGGDYDVPNAYDLTTGGRIWFGECKNLAFNFALRVELDQLKDTDEHCPIGGLVGLTWAPQKFYGMFISVAGEGKGTVTADFRLECEETGECEGRFPQKSQVAFQAVPDERSMFEGWSGDCAGTGPVTNVLMDCDKFCTATFVPLPEYTLSVEITGNGEGRVASSPAGVDCEGDCSEVFLSGTAVDLEAARVSNRRSVAGVATARPQGPTLGGPHHGCRQGLLRRVPSLSSVPKSTTDACLFDFDSSRVDNRCKKTMDEVALRLKQLPSWESIVIGHTCNIGPEGYNEKLGMKRAEAVKQYLVKRHGIDGARIETQSVGEGDPADDNSTRAAREQNRRVDVTVKWVE